MLFLKPLLQGVEAETLSNRAAEPASQILRRSAQTHRTVMSKAITPLLM